MSSQKRYRVLFCAPIAQNGTSGHDGCFRPQGHGSELADTAEQAVRRVAERSSTPTEGTWLALSDDGRWWEFTVRRRTELVIEPTDGVAEAVEVAPV